MRTWVASVRLFNGRYWSPEYEPRIQASTAQVAAYRATKEAIRLNHYRNPKPGTLHGVRLSLTPVPTVSTSLSDPA